MSPFLSFRRAAVGGLIALAVAGAGTVIAVPANAATPGSNPAAPMSAGTGWVRVGHFSPDTKAVDVEITALSGGTATTDLNDLTYGQVSKYLDMTAGTYAISMRPSGSPASSKPMLSRSLTVKAGTATTVAAYGTNAHLKTAVYHDDLSAPKAGNARIRLIQVSTKHTSISVQTTTGIPIASKATTGSATGYAGVPAGPWALEVSGSGIDTTQVVTLVPGTVTSLLVLDNASGGVTLDTITDSAAVPVTPRGGVQTGGGFFALHRSVRPAAEAHQLVAW